MYAYACVYVGCVCMYMYMYMFVFMYTRMYVCMQVYTFIHVCVCVCVCVCFVCVCVRACKPVDWECNYRENACMHACMHVHSYICMYACIHACMHACIYSSRMRYACAYIYTCRLRVCLSIARQTCAHCLHHCRSDRYVQLVTVQIDNAPDIFSEVKFSLFSVV
jgi:hypothetical protein